MMRALHPILTAGAALGLSLALCPAAHAQRGAVDKFSDTEIAPRAREAAETARVRPLIEAEKLRPRIAGTWQAPRITAIMAANGKLPPMTAASRRLYNRRIAERKAGKGDDPLNVCLPAGTPRILFMGGPVIITQAPIKVTFFHQFQHIIRHVFLDAPLKAADLDPSWQGESAGHWDGDTLTIETTGFNGKLWLDQAGLPQSPQMIVRERLRLIDADTLEDVITIDDKGAYAAPWSTTVRFKRLPDDTIIEDDNCLETHLEFPLKEYAPTPPGR